MNLATLRLVNMPHFYVRIFHTKFSLHRTRSGPFIKFCSLLNIESQAVLTAISTLEGHASRLACGGIKGLTV